LAVLHVTVLVTAYQSVHIGSNPDQSSLGVVEEADERAKKTTVVISFKLAGGVRTGRRAAAVP